MIGERHILQPITLRHDTLFDQSQRTKWASVIQYAVVPLRKKHVIHLGILQETPVRLTNELPKTPELYITPVYAVYAC